MSKSERVEPSAMTFYRQLDAANGQSQLYRLKFSGQIGDGVLRRVDTNRLQRGRIVAFHRRRALRLCHPHLPFLLEAGARARQISFLMAIDSHQGERKYHYRRPDSGIS